MDTTETILYEHADEQQPGRAYRIVETVAGAYDTDEYRSTPLGITEGQPIWRLLEREAGAADFRRLTTFATLDEAADSMAWHTVDAHGFDPATILTGEREERQAALARQITEQCRAASKSKRA